MSPVASSRAPLIGITADSSANGAGKGNREKLFFLPHRYCDAIESAGGLPIIVPHASSRSHVDPLLERLDGIVVSGGNFDIHPRYYGQKPHKKLGAIQAARTMAELESIRVALRRNLPVLGICGGAQAINVALGGSLYQDIETQLPGAHEHQQPARKQSGGHIISVEPDTLLHRIFKRRRLEVNTTHHQAVRQLGKNLAINAIAADGLIEGIESTTHSFVLGVQWHPEALTADRALHHRIFSAFILACKRRQGRG